MNRLLRIQSEARPNLARLLVEMVAVGKATMDGVVTRYQQSCQAVHEEV